jgi:hypothetical protein
MTETKLTYTVEAINRPYGASDGIPWGDAVRTEGLTDRDAIKLYSQIYRWYHPEPSAWSGHVRIVGSDRWTYIVEPPEPGERSLLCRMYHLDDL